MNRDDAAAAKQRVLDALAALPHDRPDVLADFARAVMRRIDPDELRIADPPAAARRMRDGFDTVDQRGPGEVRIDILRPPTTLDGRTPGPTVIEVACEDRPFLLSTLTDELERTGHPVIRSLHPIVGVERGSDGRISAIVPARTAQQRESLVHLELDNGFDPGQDDDLIADLHRLIDDVIRATDDFDAMRHRLTALADDLRSGTWPAIDPDEADEVADLLQWLCQGNLVLLGMREYRFSGPAGDEHVQVDPDSGLGLLRDPETSRFREPVPVASLPEHIRSGLPETPLLMVTRSSRPSTVQRRVRMQYLALTRRDASGRPDREYRILGLFTRSALAQPARTTPVLRRKLATILDREDIVPGSHDEGVLTTMFQALPKDELFQASTDTLQTMLVDLLRSEEQGEVRTLVRPDVRTSSVSVVVAVPRERCGPQLRSRIQAHLMERYGAHRVDVELSLADRQDALVRFLLHLEDRDIPEVSVTELRREIRALSRSWLDDVVHRIKVGPHDDAARRDLLTLAERLPRSYQDVVSVDDAIADLGLLHALGHSSDTLVVSFRPDRAPGTARLRVAKEGPVLELSAFLPILESLGLTVVEEVPHRLVGDEPLSLHDFGVRALGIDPDTDGDRLAEMVLAAWRGHLTIDALNQLVLVAGLTWRQVAVLRAYRRLRRQLGTAFTPEYVNDTIVSHPDIARALIELFQTRFAPDEPSLDVPSDRTQRESTAHDAVVTACDALSRLDHDRILRGLLELIDATLRTNAFRDDAHADGSGEPYLSFKLDPSMISEVPLPVPHREVFVHSPRVEGIHLRGGPVARGGLRWSDRRDDVRTEVMDLVKAQILKNGLIVPTGAKGGFVLTREPDDPAALRDEIRRQYVTFIRGLLDVTDDLDGDTLVPPPNVVRRDGDDPYLVVAADRGTATFSDTANALSRRYGYWLDDAFASGGSNGYDHKALGVTAKGAWLAVARHFRELGMDVQSDPVTVAGVGDMSGDVFGNGLLRSRTVRLVAAFDHRDIFIDPDPDPNRSFDERQRLFDLPRSSWQHYDREALSPGAIIAPRSSRSVELSDEVRALLRIQEDVLTPPALIRAILRAPVDLLFAGGIGNYVKASTERDEDVGDRANDELRVDAGDLRARVVGEGANLFITQRGRIEYARRGGRINQDAIDNAAGVSTSDHEVNLKILLSLAQAAGRMDQAERDATLVELADETVDRVMHGVDLQAAALSRELALSPARLDAYDHMMDRLAATHALDRSVEVLPSSTELAERADTGAGLARPSLATLLAWSKRELKEALLGSDLLDLDLLTPAATEQFPPTAIERFGDLVPRHRLRRELIATSLANDVVDRMGVTFVAEIADATGVAAPEVVLAYRIVRAAIDASRWWQRLGDMEATRDPQRLQEFGADLARLLEATTTTLAGHPDLRRDPSGLQDRLTQIVTSVNADLLNLGTPAQRKARTTHARWLMDDLVEDDLAIMLSSAGVLTLLPDVDHVLTMLGSTTSAAAVLDTCLRLGDELGVDRLEERLSRSRPDDPWSRRQRDGIAADLRRIRRDAALIALSTEGDTDHEQAVRSFLEAREIGIARAGSIMNQLLEAETEQLDAIAVAARAIRGAIDLARAT